MPKKYTAETLRFVASKLRTLDSNDPDLPKHTLNNAADALDDYAGRQETIAKIGREAIKKFNEKRAENLKMDDKSIRDRERKAFERAKKNGGKGND